MFALNRTANVPGRIMLLIVSIQTINGINILGVPWGTKWVNIWAELLIHPNNMNLIHSGIDNTKVIDKCLVVEKIYGNSLIEFLNKISKNNEINKSIFFLSFIFNKIFNSLLRIDNVLIHSILIRDGINHMDMGIIKNPSVVLVQLSENKGSDEGSKDENRFVIIFRLFLIFYLFLISLNGK